MSAETSPAPENTRRRLLEAARASFADKGFHATTTRDIAAAAGMSPAAVYVHHRTKEALLFELSREGHQAVLDALQVAATEHSTPTDQLRAQITAFVQRHAEHHTTARIVNYEFVGLNDEHQSEIEELRRAIRNEVAVVLEAGVEAGEFDCDNIDLTLNAITGMGVDVARWYQGDGPWTPHEIATHQAGLALRLVNANVG